MSDRPGMAHTAMGAPAIEGRLDSQGMLAATAGLPEQVEEATARATGIEGLPHHDDIENVVVMGMGGSGIAGDLLLAVAAPFMAVPVTVVKSYAPPAFVGQSTLVFAISFSGDTEETLEAVDEAADAGAAIVAVTGGGELARMAEGWGAPVIPVPASIPQPRAALGAMAIPPLLVLEEVGLFPGARRWVDLAVVQLKRRRDELVGWDSAGLGEPAEPELLAGTLADRVAKSIGRTIPLIHGAGAIGAAAAQRWKTQINENAKTPAFWAVQPELCHNEIAGWGVLGDVTRQVLTLVNLRHDGEHPQMVRRIELVNELMGEVVSTVVEVRAQGEGDLAQLLDLMLIGDLVSLYMAGAEGLDPGPVPVLVELKERLRKGTRRWDRTEPHG